MGWAAAAPAGFTRHMPDYVARFNPPGEVFGHPDHELDARILHRPEDYYARFDVLADCVELSGATRRPEHLELDHRACGDDPGFKQLVDAALGDMFRSGDFERTYQKWFESPIPPRNINLKLPMSAALNKVVQHPTDAADPAAYQ